MSIRRFTLPPWARRLVRRPGYPALAVTVLALGLAAAVSVFTYIRAFSRPFPGADADGLVQVFDGTPEDPYLDVSFLDFEDYRDGTRVFSGLAAAQPYYAASVRLEALTEVAFVEAVTGSWFDVLGVEMALGRPLVESDDRLDAEPAAVISHRWWQSTFQGDPGVLGRTVFLNYRPFTVVGVAAPDFLGSASDFRPQVWIPVAHFRDRYTGWDTQAQDRDVPLVRVYGRVRAGVASGAVAADVRQVAAGLESAYPRRASPRSPRIRPATWIDPSVRVSEASTLRVMTLSAAAFLLLVCANVANLLLAFFGGRQKEIALHAALGASPRRLFRGALLESVSYALVAGALALGLAIPLTRRLGGYFSRPSVWGENVAREFAVDGQVVVFALLVAIATGLLAGAVPALRASRRGLTRLLKASGPASRGVPRRWKGRRLPGTSDLLMIVQVALSVTLLVVAGLLLRTFAHVSDLDPGFAYGGLVTSHVSTSSTDLEIEEREAFFREMERRITEEPWVRSATVSSAAPLSGHPSMGARTAPGEEPVQVLVESVHDGFFDKLGIERVAGRTFEPADTAGAPSVVVLNRPAAERLFPEGSPVGRSLWLSSGEEDPRPAEVVGVVGDTRVSDFLAPAQPAVYSHYAQRAYPSGSALIVSTVGDPRARVADLHRWLRAFEPHLAIVNAIAYTDVVEGALYAQRMNAEMFAGLAGLGLVLAVVGLFGVVSLSVGRRTREIGLRKAVGARPREIHALVVGEGLAPVGAGIAIGLLVAWAASGLFQSLLYGVQPTDPWSIVMGSGLLLASAALAAYLPSRRAASVDAADALRSE